MSTDWDDDFDDTLFEAAAREIMSNNGYTPDMLTGSNGSALIRETFRHFDKAINVGLTETADPKVSSALRENAFVFSGFKTHAELEQVSQLLTDKNGNIRPFNQFLNDVKRLNATYNHAYLRSEYNQAVQAAQMAGKWQDFERTKDRYNLQYRTANDERVRASHRILHGTTLPVDDPFWDKYTPPNGWNCRCTVVKVLKEDYPESDPQGSTANAESCFKSPKDSIFKTNPGKELKVFPSKHPYLPKGCGNCNKGVGSKNLAYNPNSVWCQACKAIAKCKKRNFHNTDKTVVKRYPNGGIVERHSEIDTSTDDYKRIEATAKFFAKQGKHVLMTTKFNTEKCKDYQEVYAALRGTEYWRKNPDLCIDGVFYEHEGFTTTNPKNALRNMLNDGLIQSDRIIIEDVGHTDSFILDKINIRIKNGKKVSEVWIKNGNELRLLYKKSD